MEWCRFVTYLSNDPRMYQKANNYTVKLIGSAVLVHVIINF